MLSNCKYMAPSEEEIDEQEHIVKAIAYHVAVLGGMSEEAASLSGDIAFARCKRQAGHTIDAIATEPVEETTGETTPCNCEADAATTSGETVPMTTSGEIKPIETTA